MRTNNLLFKFHARDMLN